MKLLFDTAHNALRLCGLRESRANGAELDVGEDNLSIGVLGLNIGWDTAGDVALSTTGTWGFWITVGGVGRIEPEHVGVVIIPQRHNKDHTLRHTLAHGVHAAELVEGVDFLVEDLLLGVAPLLGDGVAGHAGDGGLGVLDDFAALDVEALELRELVARAQKLGHDGHLLGGIDRLALAVEVLDTHTIGVEVAAVGVAGSGVAIKRVGSTALVVYTDAVAFGLTGVGCEGS